jgi:hypothetical protein
MPSTMISRSGLASVRIRSPTCWLARCQSWSLPQPQFGSSNVLRRTSLYRSAPTTRLFAAYRRAMNNQSSCHCASVWLVFQRSLPSSPQHHRDVVVWLFRITAKPRAVRRSTTLSYTCNGVLPCRSGLAGRSGTGLVSWIIWLENGSRTLLSPSSANPSMMRSIGARSRPSGVWKAISPAWWFAGSPESPVPFHVPLAPCQLPDLSLNRLPVASTMYRPRVLNGPTQVTFGSAAVAAEGTTTPVTSTTASRAPANLTLGR